MSEDNTAAVKRQLQVEGYTAFIRAITLNPMDWSLEKLICDVRKLLNVDMEQHLSIVEKVSNEPTVRAIREGKPIPPPSSEQLQSRPSHEVHRQSAAEPQAGHSGPPGWARGDAVPDAPKALPPPESAPHHDHQQHRIKKSGKRHREQQRQQQAATTPTVSLADKIGLALQNPRKLIGRILQKRIGHAWADAIVTDYDPATDCFCFVFDAGNPVGSEEWLCLSKVPAEDFKPTGRSIDGFSLRQIEDRRQRAKAASGGGPGAAPPPAGDHQPQQVPAAQQIRFQQHELPQQQREPVLQFLPSAHPPAHESGEAAHPQRHGRHHSAREAGDGVGHKRPRQVQLERSASPPSPPRNAQEQQQQQPPAPVVQASQQHDSAAAVDEELLKRIRASGIEELSAMSAKLRKQEARVRTELIEIGGEGDDPGEEAALGRLLRERERLEKREGEIRRALQAMEG
uniref:ENT domain-containing protein n=1 Tax=Tetraselmis sp. GSL018 TaxID=582737 RepID=A0A061R7G0_9CHLO|mmetsp:Transcript_5658/g.13728  ORF Transcript_5658/g.13728 Transcript_5658/m.13728 type:complete len:456 (-) Transcript_5658:570-1937(-)